MVNIFSSGRLSSTDALSVTKAMTEVGRAACKLGVAISEIIGHCSQTLGEIYYLQVMHFQ